VLRPINRFFDPQDYPDLLVGLDSPDDAAVWRIDDERALVMTTDFFTPVVDDPYDYGAIAAANSLSDVYAMGGKPFLALNIAALPPSLDAELLGEILRGGAVKAHEAGVVIAGGHTVQDKEPKYGLVVIGFVDPRSMLTKAGARPGDRLILTKPLGFGVTTTALKQDKADPADVAEAVSWMTRLNRVASELAVEFGLRAGTDVTGFSLLGHGWELASASGAGLRFTFERLPFLQNARRYAEAGTFPGGAFDNLSFYSPYVDFEPGIEEPERMLCFDPQTSGGLLLAVSPDKLPALTARAAELEQPVWEVGEVIPEKRIFVE
jgi:selenide,water dikinase